jgi:hypothetical protein
MWRILDGFGVVVLSIIAIVVCLFFVSFSLCAVGPSGMSGHDRLIEGVFAMVALAVLLGLIYLIRKLFRGEPE